MKILFTTEINEVACLPQLFFFTILNEDQTIATIKSATSGKLKKEKAASLSTYPEIKKTYYLISKFYWITSWCHVASETI